MQNTLNVHNTRHISTFSQFSFLMAVYYAVFAMSIVLVSCVTSHNFVDGIYTPKLIVFFVFCALNLLLSLI